MSMHMCLHTCTKAHLVLIVTIPHEPSVVPHFLVATGQAELLCLKTLWNGSSFPPPTPQSFLPLQSVPASELLSLQFGC